MLGNCSVCLALKHTEDSSLSHRGVNGEVRKVGNLEANRRSVILEEERFLVIGPDSLSAFSVNGNQ